MLAAQRYAVIAVSGFLVVFSFLYFVHPTVIQNVPQVSYRLPNPLKTSTHDAIRTLFETLKVDMKAPYYTDPAGEVWEGGNETVWTKPLGKRILIVDIDTRVPTGENQVFNSDTIDWEHLEASGGGLVSNAVMNHYLYALIHGYDYKFYQAQHIPGHYDTWIRPHILHQLLPDYDFVITMDADVVVPRLEVPFEWLFNRWGIQKHTSMSLPWDTQEYDDNGNSKSTDSKGKQVYNAGFVIAHNLPYTMEMLEAWRDCTSEKRYPGCGQWKEQWSHEQRAFSEYIRYDFNKTPETIVPIPCNDAMAWPGFAEDVKDIRDKIDDCHGNFIRHYTLGKDKVKTAGATSVMQIVSDMLQQDLLKKQDKIWYKESKWSRKGWETTKWNDK